MKMTFGRKFLGCTIATTFLMAMFFATLFACREAMNSVVVTTYGIFIVTIWFAYIGGNVWSKWVTSKYFNSELKEE